MQHVTIKSPMFDTIMIDPLANRIITLIDKIPCEMKVLELRLSAGFTQCYIAAGFVRKFRLGLPTWLCLPDSLNDIDAWSALINDALRLNRLFVRAQLQEWLPELNWQVRNQAACTPEMGMGLTKVHWMRCVTGQRKRRRRKQSPTGEIECISAFGLESLFWFKESHRPNRNKDVFDQRVQSKNWLTHLAQVNDWKQLTIND